MINASYSNPSLLTLFGRGDATRLSAILAQVRAAETPVPIVTAATATPAVAPIATSAVASSRSEGGAASIEDGTRTSSYWDSEPRTAALLKLAAQREAVEAAFEAENGFRRRANPDARGRYEAALSGSFVGQGFASHNEAARWALDRVTSAAGQVLMEDRFAGLLADPGYVQMVTESNGRSPEMVKARLEDWRLAAHMEGVVEAALLDASFEVTGGPLLGTRDGSRFVNDVEVRREGRLVLTVTDNAEYPGQKTVTSYDAKGEVSESQRVYGGGPIDPAGGAADGA